jgi:hypothetical protein
MKLMKVLDCLNKRLKFGTTIKRKEFKVRDQVLLFNSHFKFSAGKLASSASMEITKVSLMVLMDNVLNIILQDKNS